MKCRVTSFSRAKEINSGEMHTVIFMETSVPKKAKRNSRRNGSSYLEISGHIDLAHRQRTENYLPYLTGEKR